MSKYNGSMVIIPEQEIGDAVQFAMNETQKIAFSDMTASEMYQEQKRIYDTIFRMGYLAGYHRNNGEEILNTINIEPDGGNQ